MKVTIYGSGYVGLVTGTCLAEVGNDVLCVDIDERKTKMLQNLCGIMMANMELALLYTQEHKTITMNLA